MPKKTPPVKVDPRVRRTRRILRDALVSLILEKDYASITIKEITDRAEVAYITFFRHYNGIDELLTEVLDEGLVELLRHIEMLAGKSEDPANEIEGKLIFEYIDQQSCTSQHCVKSYGDISACVDRMVAGQQAEPASRPDGKNL
jgi:AcrR family transcriptional regulator